MVGSVQAVAGGFCVGAVKQISSTFDKIMKAEEVNDAQTREGKVNIPSQLDGATSQR